MGDDSTKTRKGVLLPLQVSDEGSIHGMYVDEHGIEPRVLRPMKPGEPINTDEVVALSQREGTPYLDAEITSLGCGGVPTHEPASTGHDGPVRTNSKEFQSGWGRIFGGNAKEIPEA